MVLALVDGSADPAAPSFGASLVLSILLADPDIRALVEARFVPVQVGYQPGFYTAKGSVPNDPLQPLGSPAASVKGPALLVADAKGKTSAVLEGIGTWDREAVLRFLSEALPPLRGEKDPWKLLAGGSLREAAAILAKDGGPRAAVGLARIEALGGNHAKAVDLLFPLCGKGGAAAAEARTYRGVCLLRLGRTAEAAADLGAAADLEGPERARALYFLGCALWHDGKTAEARRAWERIGAECAASPWTLPAKNRLAAPERFAAFENLSAAPFAAGSRTTEVPAARANLGAVVARAADYLLDQQAPDGSWPVGESGQALCIPGITALCARALLEWRDGIGKERGERAGKAVAKAVAWLRERWTAEPPSSANSFCAAYVLAFHLARMAKDPEAKKDAVAVLPQLLGGQCDNGAWSYDRRFG
jgi:tetratricopeptide (TPR) repeat protein